MTDPNATGSVHEPVTYKPAFSNAVDLGTLPPGDLRAIVVQIGEIAHSIDAIPRQSAMWRSIRGAPLTATIKGWRVQYEVDEVHEKVVVFSVSK